MRQSKSDHTLLGEPCSFAVVHGEPMPAEEGADEALEWVLLLLRARTAWPASFFPLSIFLRARSANTVSPIPAQSSS